MDPALDEPDSYYGTLAELVTYPDDFSYVIYRLRPTARWHDGKPVTPEDVIFSFETSKNSSPRARFYYQHIVKAEKVGDHDVKFFFDSPGNRELPLITGQLNVLPKHWWEGTDAQGRKRDVTATTLEPPLGSGPYRIKDFVAGRSLVLERVKDYWGKDLPNSIGQDNFDELRYEFFRDDVVGRQAFKADQFDWYAERSAKEWSVAYDFPAVHDGRVIKEKFPVLSSGRMQGWAFNLRRPLFKDVRLRRAFNYAFDFEEMNRTLVDRRVPSRQQLFRRHPRLHGDRTSRGPRTGNAGAAARQGACRRFSRRPTRIPSAAPPKPSATICAKRRGC